ncbi:MAG TPA: tetratricopeptide repeat protein [Candidatus Acidoferrales bacterium]|nr:tetratricopeptide repeat protein [Candidatus Acidoferrales bacterium]
MKTKLRILLALLAVSLVALGGTGCTAKAKKAYHLSRADRYYKAGQFSSAEIEYMNALRWDPVNLRAQSRLGLIYYDEGRLQRAMFFLGKASQMAPDNLELRVKLGFIESSVGQSSNALAAANFVLDKDPRNNDATLLLAEGAVRPKDAEAARKRLQTLARNGDRATIEVALGNLAMRDRDVTAADADFKKAQALDSKDPAVNTALGTVAWAQGDLKQANAFFKAAADGSPIRSPRRMQYVRFKLQTGDLAAADALLAEIIQAAPDYVPAPMLRAEIAAAQKKFDESQNLLDQVQKLDPDNFDGLYFQGQLDLARGNAVQAVADMERMARLYPAVAPVHYQLGTAYLEANDPNKAAASFERALELNPNFADATVLLAQIQIQNGNTDPAIVSLEALRKKAPGLVRAQLLLADAYRKSHRVGDALAIYSSLENAYPTNEEVALLHGAALMKLGDDAGARQAFERVLRLLPGDLPAIEQLVDLDIGETNFDAATQLIDRELQRNPKQLALRLLTAKVLLAQRKRDQAEAALQQVLQIDSTNESASLLLAQIYSDTGQNEKALAKVNAVMARDTNNLAALTFAAVIYDANKDHKAAAQAYEKLLKIAPKDSTALNNLAYLYSEYLNNPDRAYELAQRARELLPFDPSTADTLGWICFQRGAYDSALALLKESAAKLNNPEVQFHLGMASYMTADEATARTALQRAWLSGVDFHGRAECGLCLSNLEVNPATANAATRALLEKRVAEKADDPIAWNRLARIYLRAGDSGQAMAAYEAVLKADPKNLDAMVNLSRFYATKDTKKAYELARAASKLAPYDPEVSHNLGRLAFLSGDYNLAVSMLQQALQSQPNNAGWLFDYALADYSIGKVSEAQTGLQNAITQDLPAAQAAQARQMLDLIALAASPAQAAAASARIAGILQSEPDDVPALMARGAASKSTSDSATAEQVYETVLSHYPDFTPAQIELARLYSAQPGKTDRAYAMAIKAHNALPDDPAAAKILGIVLVQRGDYSRAVAALMQCAAQPNADAEVFYYLGAAQAHLKNRTEGRANLQKALALNLSAPLAASAKQMLTELK